MTQENKDLLLKDLSVLIKNKVMKLQEFLNFIEDEEVRIELEIDDPTKDDYFYSYFWLSDFRTSDDIAKYYKDCKVQSFSFIPEASGCDIKIQIKL